nr:unnamed protein product [Digitaria exilis]
MEHLFMQAFERREWLAAQMQQQVDSYSQTLANSLLAAGHAPPEWLLPSTALPQELNGKPIFLTGRHITTPAANRSIFMPLAVPSTLSSNSEVPNGCTYPDSNCTALGNDIHEEEHQDQTSLSHGISEACTADKMFSRIQRSRSRQRHIEDRLNGKDQAAKSGSHDGMEDGKHMSDVGTLGPNRATAPSSSIPCDAAANIAETTSSGPGQDMDFCATQVRSIDHGVQLEGFPSHIESKIICSNSNIVVSNNSSVRDSLTVPLPDLSKASIADSVCDHIPETHMLVEPKKLQFDGIGSTCMNHTSAQTDQQQESGVKSDHLDLASIIPSTEGPSSTSSQGPHSMGRLSLDHVRLGHLNPDSAPVDQHHKYAIECSQPDLTGMHSPNKKQSLTCLAEASDAMGEPLLQKDTEHIPENYSLERAHPRVSRPLEMDTSNSDDSKFSQRPCSGFNPLLESDTLRAIEDTEKLQASNSHVSPPYCGPLQLPTQLADSRFGTHALSGTSPNSLLGEDGHLSKLPKNVRNSQYSQGRSALSLELLPAQICNSNDVCPSSLLCCRTQSTDKHSNGCAAVNNLASAGKELSQEPYLSSRSSLEFNGSIPDAETPSGHPALDMENLMLKANPVPDLVNCYSGKLCDDALVSKVCGGSADDRKNESVVLKVMPSDSYQRTTEMHGTEMNSVVSSEKCNESLHQGKEQVTPHAEDDAQINADSCRSEDIERRKSEFTLDSHEKSSRHQEDRGSAQMRSGAGGVQINGGTSSKRKRIKCKDIVLTSSYDTKPLSPNHHDVTSTHVVTGENFSGRSQPSGRYFLRSSGSGEFMSLKSETTNHKMSVASDAEQNDNSSHKLRNRSCLSDISLCNSSSAKALSPHFDSGISSKIAVEEMDLNNYQTQLQNVFDVETTSPLPSSSNIALDNMELCKQQVSAPIALVHGKLSYGSSIEVDRKFRSEDLTGVLLSDDMIPRQKDDESVDFNDTMPHFESFDFSVPFDSPTTEERTFEILHDSRQFATFGHDVSKKYQMNTLSVKKDVRVKALEAAEAAKRLEEKKQNEREMRKAAAKLEREKLKHEKELKRKHEEEQKKKRDVDVATRKRQRDDEERKEKERKRKCVEEARKQQRQPMERRHANSEKDARPKPSDKKELQKNLAEVVKGQVKHDEMKSLGDEATKSNSEKVVVADERPTVIGSQSQENIPTSLEESYMMTPYKDSDDEDEDFELKEESRRRRKLIPSWARGENLEKILLSNYVLDHREIFERKCSSNLSEICPVHIPQRGFR